MLHQIFFTPAFYGQIIPAFYALPQRGKSADQCQARWRPFLALAPLLSVIKNGQKPGWDSPWILRWMFWSYLPLSGQPRWYRLPRADWTGGWACHNPPPQKI